MPDKDMLNRHRTVLVMSQMEEVASSAHSSDQVSAFLESASSATPVCQYKVLKVGLFIALAVMWIMLIIFLAWYLNRREHQCHNLRQDDSDVVIIDPYGRTIACSLPHLQ